LLRKKPAALQVFDHPQQATANKARLRRLFEVGQNSHVHVTLAAGRAVAAARIRTPLAVGNPSHGAGNQSVERVNNFSERQSDRPAPELPAISETFPGFATPPP
jgi:hypothetical protein